MKHWYVKELSKITHISVRTLYHYDEIGLLKPSIRRPNGYRLYTEIDLVKLQQILALKFFGFDLGQIRILLEKKEDVEKQFRAQSQLLGLKAASLLKAQKALDMAANDFKAQKSISWEKIINLIEVFQMTEQYRNSWIEKAFSPNEMEEYARFEQSLKKRFNLEKKALHEKQWAEIVSLVKQNLNKDPRSDFGMKLGKQCMDFVNELYGTEFANLKKKVWEKGFKGGHVEAEYGGSPEIVAWLDQACDAYWRQKIYAFFDTFDTLPEKVFAENWASLLTEMYGNEKHLKDELIQIALKDDKVSAKVKNWLKSQS